MGDGDVHVLLSRAFEGSGPVTDRGTECSAALCGAAFCVCMVVGLQSSSMCAACPVLAVYLCNSYAVSRFNPCVDQKCAQVTYGGKYEKKACNVWLIFTQHWLSPQVTTVTPQQGGLKVSA